MFVSRLRDFFMRAFSEASPDENLTAIRGSRELWERRANKWDGFTPAEFRATAVRAARAVG